MSISTTREAYERVSGGSGGTLAEPETAIFRRRCPQASRRAVLHIQASGDPAAPDDLAAWFTERAFNFYVAGLRMPGRSVSPPGQACADLDRACGYLRGHDGMDHLIVTAQGRAALAAALWSDSHRTGPDGLVLCDPDLPAALSLSIGCPVLVLTCAPARPARPRLRGRRHVAAPQLGGHVTWLRLDTPSGGSAGRSAFFAALGRWLGAYMYTTDQLL